jgi:hypothetical protein
MWVYPVSSFTEMRSVNSNGVKSIVIAVQLFGHKVQSWAEERLLVPRKLGIQILHLISTCSAQSRTN